MMMATRRSGQPEHISQRRFPRRERLHTQHRIVYDCQHLLREGAQVIADQLPISVKVDRWFILDELDK